THRCQDDPGESGMRARLLCAAVAFVASIVSATDRAHAALVTWSWSGTASVQPGYEVLFPNGSLYSAAVTFDSDVPWVSVNSGVYMYDSIVSITFDAPGYHASYAPMPGQSTMGLWYSYIDVNARTYAPQTQSSPGFLVRFAEFDTGTPDLSHLPIQPPPGGFPDQSYVELYMSPYDAAPVTSRFSLSDIQVSV